MQWHFWDGTHFYCAGSSFEDALFFCFRFLTGAIIFSGLVQLELCSTWLNSFNQGIPSKTLCLKLFLLIWPQFAQYCSILFQLEFRKSKSLEKCTFYGACSISDMKKSKQTLPVILPFLQFPSSLPELFVHHLERQISIMKRVINI